MCITPEQVAGVLPTAPVLSTRGLQWGGLTLERYRHSSSRFDLAALRDHALVLRLAGQALFEERGENGRVERHWTDGGRMSLAPAGRPVTRVITGKSDILIMHLRPSIVAEVVETVFDRDASGVQLQPRYAQQDRQVDWISRLLLAEAEAEAPGSTLAADMLARSLALQLVRSHSNLSPQVVRQAPAITGVRLRRVIEFMRVHLAEEMPLAKLAGISGLSQTQFARAFRQAVGEPPHRYIIGLRIERARDLLENSGLSIIQVAMECGFEQPNHFASMFRQHTGMSPRAWRHLRRF